MTLIKSISGIRGTIGGAPGDALTPIDIVKFDRGMTNAYFDNGKGKPVMDAAMGMIQKLKLEIVSEGIEEKEQFAKLDELGIDYIQGYYFSKPRNAAEFISFIESNNA